VYLPVPTRTAARVNPSHLILPPLQLTPSSCARRVSRLQPTAMRFQSDRTSSREWPSGGRWVQGTFGGDGFLLHKVTGHGVTWEDYYLYARYASGGRSFVWPQIGKHRAYFCGGLC
jgi:hypothetical protein